MRPVRLVHTSDVHLDTSFASAGFGSGLGGKKRAAIRATFRRIVDDTRAGSADLLLVAGDLFEHEHVTADTVAFLKQQLGEASPVRVFIAPGNHDPYLHGSPYHDADWPDNVHVFRDEEFRSILIPELGVRVTGFGYCRSSLPERHLARLPALPGDAVNVVLAHASDVTRVPPGKARHGPFEIADVAGKNVAYCALGHYHEQRRIPNPLDAAEVWYAGIPEGRGWDETGTLAYLKATLDGGAVTVESVACNRIPLREVEVDCEGFATREQVLDALLARRGSAFDAQSIVRVRLAGTVDAGLDLSTAELDERLTGAALHFHWEDRTRPALDFEDLARQNTLCGRYVRAFAERLSAPDLDPDRRARLERARLYGAQALLGREVRTRWS
jgi:DNA repair exonuclease SbcCD nuclease subunit